MSEKTLRPLTPPDLKHKKKLKPSGTFRINTAENKILNFTDKGLLVDCLATNTGT